MHGQKRPVDRQLIAKRVVGMWWPGQMDSSTMGLIYYHILSFYVDGSWRSVNTFWRFYLMAEKINQTQKQGITRSWDHLALGLQNSSFHNHKVLIISLAEPLTWGMPFFWELHSQFPFLACTAFCTCRGWRLFCVRKAHFYHLIKVKPSWPESSVQETGVVRTTERSPHIL